MKKFVFTLSIVFGVNSFAFSAQPASNSVSAAPVVIDSTGKTIGRIVPQLSGGSVGVLTSYQAETVGFVLTQHLDSNNAVLSTGYNWAEGPLYYTTSDCTGQSYISSSQSVGGFVGQGSTRWSVAVHQGNQWLGYLSSNATPQVANLNSRILGGSCSGVTFTVPALPVAATISLDGVGIAPFYTK